VERGADDTEGNLIEQTDGLGNTTRFRYSGFNKLVERIDPAGGVVAYAYDTEESWIGITNEAGEEYKFEVDLAGRVVPALLNGILHSRAAGARRRRVENSASLLHGEACRSVRGWPSTSLRAYFAPKIYRACSPSALLWMGRADITMMLPADR